MVKDTFVPFETFMANAQIIENNPFSRMLQMWVIGSFDMTIEGTTYHAEDYQDRKFLPYPYQRNYISKFINWQSGYNSINTHYQSWIEDVYRKESDKEKSITELIYSKVPIFFEDSQRPTFYDFFKERILPFLISSISEEEFEECKNNIVVIGLERNTHLIVKDNRNYELKVGRIENETGNPVVTVGIPASNQLYVKYNDGHCVFLGDEDYNMFPKILIELQKNTFGTIYLYDNLNLE